LEGSPVVRSPEQLRLHHALEELGWTGAIDEFNDAARLTNPSVTEPILITTNGTILAGFGRWRSAVFDGRHAINCIEYPLSEDEALQFIISHHQPHRGWNAFIRILLALKLEPYFQKKALDNMRAGGKYKGSSNLTEADRVDVRREIAAAAGVCPANVSKVKELTKTARPQLLQALRSGEISIHRAWLWSKEPSDKQLVELRRYRDNRAANKIKRLISRHKSKNVAVAVDPSGVVRRLAGLHSNRLAALNVRVVKGCGETIYLTEELLQSLPPYQEQMPT
jgi:hypothetical protein